MLTNRNAITEKPHSESRNFIQLTDWNKSVHLNQLLIYPYSIGSCPFYNYKSQLCSKLLQRITKKLSPFKVIFSLLTCHKPGIALKPHLSCLHLPFLHLPCFYLPCLHLPCFYVPCLHLPCPFIYWDSLFPQIPGLCAKSYKFSFHIPCPSTIIRAVATAPEKAPTEKVKSINSKFPHLHGNISVKFY